MHVNKIVHILLDKLIGVCSKNHSKIRKSRNVNNL